MSKSGQLPRAAMSSPLAGNSHKRSTLSRSEIITRLDAGERDFSDIQAIGVDFSRLDLSGCDFSGANLSRSKFSQADGRGASFVRANLFQARFVYSNLDDADFKDSAWSGATFVKCSVNRTVIQKAAQQAETSEEIAERTLSGMSYRRP